MEERASPLENFARNVAKMEAILEDGWRAAGWLAAPRSLAPGIYFVTYFLSLQVERGVSPCQTPSFSSRQCVQERAANTDNRGRTEVGTSNNFNRPIDAKQRPRMTASIFVAARLFFSLLQP